ncbi:MAG: hypothetical protein WC760_02280 [Bacteroidia bacterium]|jgi:hypothetical protein
MRLKCVYILLFLGLGCTTLQAQQSDKRRLSKQEIQFLTHKMDSVKNNLNRMIRYERELMQRNYYLNEKTALVDELIATVQYLQRSVDVIIIGKNDVRKIFGHSRATLKDRLVYEIETYRSNCPFLELTFFMKQDLVFKVEYRITECQKWK